MVVDQQSLLEDKDRLEELRRSYRSDGWRQAAAFVLGEIVAAFTQNRFNAFRQPLNDSLDLGISAGPLKIVCVD